MPTRPRRAIRRAAAAVFVAAALVPAAPVAAAGTLPGAPSKPLSTAGLFAATLEWVAPASPGSAAITDYVVQLSTNGGVTWTTSNDGVRATPTATINRVRPITTSAVWLVRVAAVTSVGRGPWSPVGSLAPKRPADAPTGVKASVGNSSMEVSWLPPAATDGLPVDHYVVRYRDDGAAGAAVRSAGSSAAVTTSDSGGTVSNIVTPRIVGGTQAGGSTPWQAMVIIVDGNGDPVSLCGGSLIDPYWIVTAAHCVTVPDTEIPLPVMSLTAYTGMSSVSEALSSNAALGLANLFVHPGYDAVTAVDDIALIQLGTPSASTPIPLYQDELGPVKGQPAVVSGYGTTSYGGSISNVLLRATIAVQAAPGGACGRYGPSAFDPVSMLCANDPGVDTCQGDSGGPLAINVGGEYQLAGVTSNGFDCGLVDYPGVYTRVSHFADWIRSTTDAHRALATPWQSVSVPCSTACNAVSIGGLTNNHAYTVQVHAVTAAGEGAWSSVAGPFVPSASPQAGSLAGAPTGVSAVARNGRLVLRWIAPADPANDPVTDYLVTLDGVSQRLVGSAATTLEVGGLANGQTYSVVVQALNNTAGSPPASDPLPATPGRVGFVAVPPTRLLDTRLSGSVIRPGVTRVLRVAGRAGLPADAAVAALNVIVDRPTAAGSMMFFDCDAARPTTTNVSFRAAVQTSQLVMADLDASGGDVCIRTSKTAHVTVGVEGFFAPEAGFQPVRTTRLLFGLASGRQRVIALPITTTEPDVPAAGVRAVVVKLTASRSAVKGTTVLFACASPVPTSPSLVFQAGQMSSNTVVVPIAGASLCVRSSTTVDLAVDVVGFVRDTVDYTTSLPTRLLDTRSTGGTADGFYSRIGTRAVTGKGLAVVVTGRGVATDASSVTVRLTVHALTAAGTARAWPCGASSTGAIVTFAAGQTLTNTMTVAVGQGGKVCVKASTPVDVTLDVDGWTPRL